MYSCCREAERVWRVSSYPLPPSDWLWEELQTDSPAACVCSWTCAACLRMQPQRPAAALLAGGGSAQPAKRHCGIAVSMRPALPSSGSWSSDPGRGGGGGGALCCFFAGFLCQPQTFLRFFCFVFLLCPKASTCPDGPPPTRKGLHFLVLHDVSWSSKEDCFCCVCVSVSVSMCVLRWKMRLWAPARRRRCCCRRWRLHLRRTDSTDRVRPDPERTGRQLLKHCALILCRWEDVWSCLVMCVASG